MASPLDPALLDRLPPELRSAVAAAVEASMETERTARRDAERRSADLAERVARLEHLIRELRRARFGRSSEKLSEDQLELAFEDIEVAIAQVQEAEGAGAPKPRASSSALRRRSRALPRDLPREERVIAPDDLAWLPCRAIGPSDNGDAAAGRWS